MIGTRGVSVGIAALAMIAVVGVATSAPAQPSGDGERLLGAARTANANRSYAGVLSVAWRDGATTHHTEAFTHVVDGQVEVGGGTSRILSEGGQRWAGAPGSWALLVRSDAGASTPPSADASWDLQTGPGPTVAGRSTTVVAVDDPSSGTPRARFFIDTTTGSLLRRDVLDTRGGLVREVSFEAFLPLGEAASPVHPETAKTEEPASLRAVPSGYDAPRSIGRGYRLLGRYRQPDGTIQLYYSDGIFTLSLFEQRGAIDWGSLPAGKSRDVNGIPTRAYSTPTSSVAVWADHGLIVTCVSDGAPDQVLGVVRGLTGAGDGSGVAHDVAHFLLGPFGWE